MGRRKERRLAAMNSGRRVKLDLFAEPSGDLGASSTQEGVEGDCDSKSHAEFPDSPSSSGKRPQNPLLLLEQYSDEELENDSNEVQNDAIAEDASIGADEQSKAASIEKGGPAETNNGKDLIEEVEGLFMDNTAASKCPSEKPQKESIEEIDSNDLLKQTNKMKESLNSAVFDENLVGDVSSGWKMVLHEESNLYYYWNVTTGETSWEVPDGLAQQTVETSEENATRDSAGEMDAIMRTNQLSTPLGTAEDDFTTRELSVHRKFSSEADETKNSETSDCVYLGTEKDVSNDGCRSDTINVKEGNRDANQDQGTFLLGGHSIECNNATDLSLQLVKQYESLLERLNSVKGLNCYLEGQDLKSKCSLEIEIRLADIKALSSYESCLLPFWLHSEAQLNRLEAAVDCVIQQVNPASQGGFDAEIGSSETKALLATSGSHVVENTEKSIFGANDDGATTMEHALYSSAHPGNDLCQNSEVTGTEKGSELNPKPALDSEGDVDMDVDMEVEDTTSIRSPHTGASGAQYHTSVEPLDVQSTLPNQEPKVPGQVGVPPDEEGIPPPPSDDEPFPPLPPDDEPFPPPPDEPLETSYPPPYLSSVQAIPYSGEYALSYPGPGPGLEYYVQTNPEASVSTLYTSEGGQLALPHLPHYYEAGPNVYPVAPAIVNPVEPTSYYGLQNGILNPVSMMHNSTAESSGAKGEPASREADAAVSFDSRPEAQSNLLLKNNYNVDTSLHSTAIVPPEVPESRHSTASSSMTNVAPAPSTSDTISSSAAAAAAAAAMKSQPKVSRTKKRTVAVVSTLRSNKKVSSLVDKWKAAKEELHEEAEEPEDAFEILEKKRQREIEKWRANQIASGEAKDNANFQPLGGDWRERVKRRRAEKMKESGQSSSEVCVDRNEQQPDLIKLSKGLPLGWQAYWDESSKKVYYGNVLTSVTMWTRPTD